MDVAVLGAGPLGRDLAAVAARTGHAVHLHDAEATAAMDAIDEVERRLGDAADGGDLSEGERADAVDRIDPTTGLDAAVGEADLVIVTGRTDETELQAAFAEIEELVDRETIVATTTGDGSVTAAAAGLRRPDRAIGLHVREPREANVIEVVVADQTTDETLERTTAFVEALGYVPAVVRDTPGVVSTRLALLAEAEAMRLVADGVAGVEAVDDAFAMRYDHPMGPLERADRAGLDQREEAMLSLAESLGGRFQPPDLLSELVAAGATGLQSGEGFYVWENAEPAGSALPDPDVVERVAGPDDPVR